MSEQEYFCSKHNRQRFCDIIRGIQIDILFVKIDIRKCNTKIELIVNE